jgi:hypothetical protein
VFLEINEDFDLMEAVVSRKLFLCGFLMQGKKRGMGFEVEISSFNATAGLVTCIVFVLYVAAVLEIELLVTNTADHQSLPFRCPPLPPDK